MLYDAAIVTLTPGTSLGPYRIVGALGAGGMGEVYEALDSRLGRSVAVKVISPDVAADENRVARFEREARLSSSLNHANIVTIHEFAHSDGVAYIAMELVDGQSLRAALTAGRLPPKRVFALAAQLAEGMAAAHAVGIVHRDLKPENVMITKDGVVKILDFGLARAEASSEVTMSVHLTGAHQVMGTVAYMSPEHATGAPVDFRSDQFAFGTILYEMAAGANPFRRASTMAVLDAIQHEDPPSLADADPAYPELFVWIAQRCLSKEPADRYASTRDLARDLAHLRNTSQGRMTAAGKQPTRRNALPAVTLLLGILAAALAGALFLRKPASDEDRARTYVTLNMPEVATAANEAVTPFALTPDGRRIIVAGSGPQHTGLFMRDLSSVSAVAISGTENGYAPALSPDGRQLAFFADGKLKIVPLEGGPPRTVAEAGESSMSWGPEGTILLARNGEWGTEIFLVKAAGGTPKRLTHHGAKQAKVFHRWPELLPDGKNFLYLAVTPPGREDGSGRRHVLMAGTLDGAAPKEIGPIDSRVAFHGGKLLYVRNGTLLAHGFDVDTMSLTGDPVPIADGVHNYTSSGVAAFAVSRSGTIVYRRPRGNSRLVWFERGGLQGSELAQLVLGRQPGSISPDGRRYATGVVDTKVGAADVWIYDFARKNAARLTYGDADDTRPVWSADGRSLFFRSDSADGGGPPDVYRKDFGSETKQLVFHGPDLEEPSDISPDGKHMLVERWNETTGTDVLLVSLADGRVQDLVKTPFGEAHARFSPDGKWVALQSSLSGSTEVYLVAFPQPGTPLRVSAAGGRRPRWRGDGRELFYLAGQQVMAVDVRSNGATIEVGEPRLLFRAGTGIVDFEVLPDGQKFLVRTPEESAPEVHLVIDALPAVP